MNFSTPVPIGEGFPKIDHKKRIFLMGSCFVENIGRRFDWFKYQNLQNPIGIIFHSSPMRKFFQRLASNEPYTEKDVFEFNEAWQSMEAHSVMRRKEKQECINDLNKELDNSMEFIRSASHVIISLGTAWAYVERKSEKVVANCHKVPQKEFYKELSSVEQIINDLEVIAHSLNELNDELKIILTVSPVRHLKDGLIENQRSKAHLITAVHQFLERKSHKETFSYFPSYEILMDELRDYRFYSEDMLHPNEVAVKYIWKKFSENWISENSLELNKEIDKIQRGLSHQIRAENSISHKKFLTKIKTKIEEIHKKYPEITFS